MLRNVIVLSMALAMAGPAWAQTKTSAARSTAADAPTRIAVINIQAAIASTEEGRQTAQELQAKFAPRQSKINDISKQIQDIQQRVQDGQNTLSDSEKQRLQLQYQELTRNLQREQREYQEDTQDARTDAVDSIGQKMMPIINRYASRRGYSVVLDTSAQASPVLFASNSVDITGAIVKLYNEAYSVKSATAPKPKAKP
ncbi:MAG TPA: OmpH family outer membrane protein [Patescibacteria group bacterium]|nr:OmpH family outer membrane protein [Patescibacteria group bacterium]